MNSCGRNFKNVCVDSESTPPIYDVCQFSVKKDNVYSFGVNFGEIRQLCATFWFKYCWGCSRELGSGWNELGEGGWSWVDFDMSWVVVDGARWRWLEVNGAGFRWVHDLVIPSYFQDFRDSKLLNGWSVTWPNNLCLQGKQ